MVRLLVILLSLHFSLFALHSRQISILHTAYDESLKYKAINGHVFNDTICAIYLTESSAGVNIIGDNLDLNSGNYKTLFESSVGPGQVRLQTALFVMNKFHNKFKDHKQLIHKDINAFKKYVVIIKNINKFRKIYKNFKRKYDNVRLTKSKKHNEKLIELKNHYKAVYKWAYHEYIKNRKLYREYKSQIYKDKKILNLLIQDVRFSVKISVLYLIYNYNYAIKHHMRNPYMRAISAYNGGWNNIRYYKRVIRNLRYFYKVKRKIIHSK